MLTEVLRRASRPQAVLLAMLLAVPELLPESQAVWLAIIVWLFVPVALFRVLVRDDPSLVGALAWSLRRFGAWPLLVLRMWLSLLLACLAIGVPATLISFAVPGLTDTTKVVVTVAIGIVAARWALAVPLLASDNTYDAFGAFYWATEHFSARWAPLAVGTALFFLSFAVDGATRSGAPAIRYAGTVVLAAVLLTSAALIATCFRQVVHPAPAAA